ncbi:SUN domain-containing protein 1-like [Thalassophryne amazonica]|uniref:SUN domain-containing protein 1-like n=1 Tax=Thalassophryne amazonica TaxID=390379 RepID=UPI0014708955|nr:SUN domain-containing protein 1-like [Thalassophryne amazonica]
MSRRSLHLRTSANCGNEGMLDRSLPHSSASYSVGGPSWRSTKSLKSRRSHTVSCSESLLHQHTPCKHNSSLHSVASDASLLSSLLDESSIQETTLVEGLLGLDQEDDHKESTVLADQNSVISRSHGSCLKHAGQTQAPALSKKYCKDCEPHSDRKEECTASAAAFSSGPTDSEHSFIYSQDKRHKRMTAHSYRGGVMNLKTTSQDSHPTTSLWRTAAEVFKWFRKQWHHMTNRFLLIGCFLRLLLVLVSLLLFSICWCHLTVRTVDEPKVLQTESLHSEPPTTDVPAGTQQDKNPVMDGSVRLAGLEQSLQALWESVIASGRQVEEKHSEMSQLQHRLQQQLLSAQSTIKDLKPWLASQLGQQLHHLRGQLSKERIQREQIRQRDLLMQQQWMSCLDQLELQLRRMEEIESSRREASTVSLETLHTTDGVCVDRQSHDALLAEVKQLKAALEDMKEALHRVSELQDDGSLDRIQQTISAQVHEEVWGLIYGNQLMLEGGAAGDPHSLPESFLQWLSQHYVSRVDLQASVASLKLNIIENISLYLERHQDEGTVRDTVVQTTTGGAVTEEEVHVIVKNALRLFSEDRTGLADYALESGGGSILTTLSSETYKSRAALISLFGIPLGYFYHTPRTVIQPDVYPGNCWAFRGSSGFLAIRLSMMIIPTAFSMEHLPKALAPGDTYHSAPRQFSVYGLDDDSQEEGKLLGSYTYDVEGEAVQTYPTSEENSRAYQIIKVQVLSNWGSEDYTCMYRFRVHGTPSGQ